MSKAYLVGAGLAVQEAQAPDERSGSLDGASEAEQRAA